MSPIRHAVLLVSAGVLSGYPAVASANHPHVGGAMAHGFGGSGVGLVFPVPVAPFQLWAPPVMAPSMPQGNVPVWGAQTAATLCRSLGIEVPPVPERHTLRGHSDTVTCVAFSPDGSILASGSGDRTVILWDMVNQRRGATLREHSSGVCSLAFSPDGSTLATGSSDRRILLWDLANNRVRSTLTGHVAEVTAVAYAPDGKTLASADRDGRIMLWDVAAGRVRATMEGRHGRVWELIFTPDGETLAAGVFVTGVTVWEVSTAQLKEKRRAWHMSETTAAAAKFGSSTLALARGRDGTIWLQDFDRNEEPTALSGHHGAVRCMAFGPGGILLASGGRDRSVRIWNVSDERERWYRILAAITRRQLEIEDQRQREIERERDRRERDRDK